MIVNIFYRKGILNFMKLLDFIVVLIYEFVYLMKKRLKGCSKNYYFMKISFMKMYDSMVIFFFLLFKV